MNGTLGYCYCAFQIKQSLVATHMPGGTLSLKIDDRYLLVMRRLDKHQHR